MEKVANARDSEYDAGEMSVEELIENAKEIEKAVYEKAEEIGKGEVAVDSVLELAGELADVREMEDSLLEVLVNTETEEEEETYEVLLQ